MRSKLKIETVGGLARKGFDLLGVVSAGYAEGMEQEIKELKQKLSEQVAYSEALKDGFRQLRYAESVHVRCHASRMMDLKAGET